MPKTTTPAIATAVAADLRHYGYSELADLVSAQPDTASIVLVLKGARAVANGSHNTAVLADVSQRFEFATGLPS